jgi:hypothetical protein
MGKWFAAAFKWLLKHPEVAQVVVEAVRSGKDKQGQ